MATWTRGRVNSLQALQAYRGRTVYGWDPARKPVEIGSFPHYLQGFMHSRWCRISAINSITRIHGTGLFTYTFFVAGAVFSGFIGMIEYLPDVDDGSMGCRYIISLEMLAHRNWEWLWLAILSYCWWKESGDHQLIFEKIPFVIRIFFTSQVVHSQEFFHQLVAYMEWSWRIFVGSMFLNILFVQWIRRVKTQLYRDDIGDDFLASYIYRDYFMCQYCQYKEYIRIPINQPGFNGK